MTAYRPGDRVRSTFDGFMTNDEPMPKGTLGTVVEPEMYPFLPPGVEKDMLTHVAKTMYPLAVKWDDAPPDQIGHDFYLHTEEEVEPA